MPLRQPPPDPQIERSCPKGFLLVWKVDPRWRVASEEEHRDRHCRRPGCVRRPAAAYLRSNGWWLYCDWHMYAHRINQGRVEFQYMEPVQP